VEKAPFTPIGFCRSRVEIPYKDQEDVSQRLFLGRFKGIN